MLFKPSSFSKNRIDTGLKFGGEVVSEERKRALNCQSVSDWNRAIVSLAEGASAAAAIAKRAKLARFLPGNERCDPLHS